MIEPGTPEWEFERRRQAFNVAGAEYRAAQRRLEEAVEALVAAAESCGRAEVALRDE